MAKIGLLAVGIFLIASVKGFPQKSDLPFEHGEQNRLAGDWDDGDGGDDFQCHILYEYDATNKVTVTSPYYGKRPEYHNGLWCEYRIRSPPGTRIKMTFEDFDLQASGSCMQDRLVIYGKDKESVLGIFCGSQKPYPILSNEGENEIRLLIQTDFMAGGRGFVATFESGINLGLCESGYTVCSNRNCYKNEKKCDGVDDCGDGTDEENCGFPIVTSPSECGVTPIKPNTIFNGSDRMVGGDIARPNSWPWQASLQMSWSEPNGHFCGGTLINAQWVLTASHCIAGRAPDGVKVHLGAHSPLNKTKYEQVRRAIKIIAYPDLEGEDTMRFSFTHDISLVKLNAPVQFNDGVQPACLPSLGTTLTPGMDCYVTGWGETRGTGGSAALKQQLQKVQSTATCSYDVKTQICVANPKASPCHGDSGGPLACLLGGRWFVFGATSTGTTSNMMTGLCTGPDSKTIYSNAATKADWIKTVVNKYS
ncbi:chymotrypsin-like elastase family member 2A isoform X1 [Uloborus diversus]|uniref:chymotrypsin-like elastase family member 2A isoform X1 n=1 Tax=Uloborus diversus TaxID=327109 RepID=UPI002409DF04|nr:chymotrypsin-like elastase family member 2A isoform X1 [Uloborus diversus]